jgi:hypothetical protein
MSLNFDVLENFDKTFPVVDFCYDPSRPKKTAFKKAFKRYTITEI